MERIVKLTEWIISKLKKDVYRLDARITSIQLLRTLLIRVAMVLRGGVTRLFVSGNGLIFKGRHVKIINASNVVTQGTITLEDNSLIDARVRDRVRIGANFTLGRNSIVEGFGVLTSLGESLIIGNNVGVSANSMISVRGTVSIGNNVIIGPYFSLHSENHNFNLLNVPIKEQGTTRYGVIIEDDVWIGAKVTVLDGVRIHSGAVIAAGAVVTRDVPQNSIMAGVPAKKLKKRGLDKEINNDTHSKN